MNVEDYLEFEDDEIKIKGHRIYLQHVLFEHINRRQSVEQLVERFPTLTLEEIYAVLLYYQHNKAKCEKYLATILEHEQMMRDQQEADPTSLIHRLRKIK